MPYQIRKLDEDDWRIFSEIRLIALRTDPNVFGSTYEIESLFSEEDWRQRAGDPDAGIFAIFEGVTPVGMTGVAIDRDDPTRKTALLWGSWIEPSERGKGLSKLLYSSRIDWAKDQPGIERIIVSHRESNVASKHANQKFGFRETHITEKVWSDGLKEKEFHYELILSRPD